MQTNNNQSTSAQKQQDYSNEELVYREKVLGTPFTIVGTEQNGYFLTLGNYALTNPRTEPELVEEDMHENMWDIMLALIVIVVKTEMQEQTRTDNKSKDSSSKLEK